MRLVAPLCAAVALLAAACVPKGETPVKDSAATAAPPVVDAAAVRQAIEQAKAKYIDAVTRGDSAGFVANYADDAVSMEPGVPVQHGRGELGANFAKRQQEVKVSDMKASTASVDVAGDYTIETGSYELTFTPKGGKPMYDKGNYLMVWKKQTDGSWKIYRDINNSDGPRPKS